MQRWEEDLDWGTKWVPVGHSSFMVADGLAGRYHNQWVGTMHLRQGSDILKLMTYDGKWTEGKGGRERQKAGTEKYNAHPRGIKGTDGRMVGGGRSEQPYGPDKKEMSRRQHLTIVTFIHNFWGRMIWGPTVMDLGREDDVSANSDGFGLERMASWVNGSLHTPEDLSVVFSIHNQAWWHFSITLGLVGKRPADSEGLLASQSNQNQKWQIQWETLSKRIK